MRTIAKPDEFRNKIISQMTSLKSPAGCEFKKQHQVKNIEISIYNYALQEADNNNTLKQWDNPFFVMLYIDRMRSVFYNLENTDLIDRVNSKAIHSHEIGAMSHQEMNMERWKDLLEQKRKRDKQKTQSNANVEEGEFECKKCGSKKTTYYQMQTRSADEPMTTFVQCTQCPTKWRC